MTYRWRLVGGAVVLALLVAAVWWFARPSGTSVAPPKGQLEVVAAENFWGNIAGQLGGSQVHVTSIITDPNADPHLYESNARNAAVVSSANVVIMNGLGYDDFMNKLVQASTPRNRIILTAATIMQALAGSNPHLWYDIPQIHVIATAISQAYITADPAHTRDYQRYLATFVQSLQPLDATIAAIKQHDGGAPVAYTEPVPGYLLAAAGLDVKTPEGFAKAIEDGDEPSPADTNAMHDLIANRAIKVLLYNSQATSPVTEDMKALASQMGIPVIGVSETLPSTEQSYQSWMQDELNALQSALGK